MGLLWNGLYWFNYHNTPNCMEESGCVLFFPPLSDNSHITLTAATHVIRMPDEKQPSIPNATKDVEQLGLSCTAGEKGVGHNHSGK